MRGAADPVELAIFQSAVHSIAEEMGAALRRTALSPNIKERRDYSCAVFDGQAQGDCHGRPHAGASRLDAHVGAGGRRGHRFRAGRHRILNDPYAGGTHLPDITMVLPVFPTGAVEARVLCGESRSSCGCWRCISPDRWDRRTRSFKKGYAFLR